MPIYQCPRCHYDTIKKDDLRRHYNRKRKCKTLFSRLSIKDCLEELEIKSDLSKIELEIRNRELEEKIKQLENKSFQVVGNNITNNITNNIQININNFDQTNYHIALDDLKNSIKQSLLKNDGMNLNIECENLVEIVHCNDKYPENHNILITDKTRGNAKIKKGDKFVVVPKDDAIDQTAQNIVNLLKDNKIFTKYIKFHENKDEETIKEDKKAIERTLYNNRDKIVETAKIKGIKL